MKVNFNNSAGSRDHSAPTCHISRQSGYMWLSYWLLSEFLFYCTCVDAFNKTKLQICFMAVFLQLCGCIQ